jgi:HEAT repeat protein
MSNKFTKVVAAILCGAVLGCGSGVPRDFQVSGKPIEHWLSALHDPHPGVREKAVQALGNVGPHHPQAIPAITAALDDADARVRAQAALALLKSGPQAKSATAALTKARSDGSPQVREYAAKALEKIGS